MSMKMELAVLIGEAAARPRYISGCEEQCDPKCVEHRTPESTNELRIPIRDPHGRYPPVCILEVG